MIRLGSVLALGCLLATSAPAQTALTSTSGSQAPARKVYCNIAPSEVIDLSSQLPGIVQEVFVRPGDKVKAGEPVVRLDTDLVQADAAIARARAENRSEMIRAKAQLDAAEARLSRIRTAFDNQAIAANELEQAKLEVDLARSDYMLVEERQKLAKLDVKKYQLQLAKSVIYAPSNGVVGETLISVGETSLNQSLAQLFVISPVRIEAFVASQILGEFMTAETYEVAIGDARYELSIDHVSPVADQSSRSTSVYFYLEADAVRPGLDCVIDFD